MDWVDKSKRKSHRSFRDLLKFKVNLEKSNLVLNAVSAASGLLRLKCFFLARDSCNPFIANKVTEIDEGFSFCKYFSSAKVSSHPSAQK